MKRCQIQALGAICVFCVLSMMQKVCAQTMDAPAEVEGQRFIALQGHDVYKAGNYRYGPSVIVNRDGTIDAWFAAAGSTYSDDIMEQSELMYVPSADHSPVHISELKVAAQRFSVDKPFYSVAVSCPTWEHNKGESVALALYRWRGSYNNTLKQKPLCERIFTDLRDNQWAEICLDSQVQRYFKPGTYLWTVSDASKHTGVWVCKQSVDSFRCRSFADGRSVDYCFESLISREPHPWGHGSYWDQISYQHSNDGGTTWSKELMTLKPTYGSEDQLSICDPGVAQWGGYYYIGYTSTQSPRGLDNNVYVARSKSPAGPWEKWNGDGWGGGKVAAVIEYTGNPLKFGAGEPCFVVKNKKVYLYYTWNDGGVTTRLATADAEDENWPAHLMQHGTVIDKSGIERADHCDVKFCDDFNCFIAVNTIRRMSRNSGIMVWQSFDGINFIPVGKLGGELHPYLHNCGISGDAQGHITLRSPQYIMYAYGRQWANWNTAMHLLQFTRH